jgi:hypothetical protein
MEVLLGIIVIVFALFGVLDLIQSNQHLSLRAQRRAVAVELARARMAEIQAAGFQAVTDLWAKSSSGPAQEFLYPSSRSPFDSPYNAKLFRWQARFIRENTAAEVINVEVRVFWDIEDKTPQDELLGKSVSIGGLLARK